MFQAAYMGFSPDMVRALSKSPDFCLQYCASEPDRRSPDYLEAVKQAGCPLYDVRNDRDLEQVIHGESRKIDLVISHMTTMIIHEKLLNQYPFFNLHSGSLTDNKGAHPIAWSVLLDQKQTELSLYRMAAQIDDGLLVDTYLVPIGENDTPLEIRENLEKGIPQLLSSLAAHLRGEKAGKQIQGGIYRRKIRESDFTVRPTDTARQVICKIRSQKTFKGAVLMQDGRKYYLDDWKELESRGKFDFPDEKSLWLERQHLLVHVKSYEDRKPKLLLLGGSAQQVVAIERAKEMGFDTVLCDYLTDNPGQYAADRFYLISTTDKQAVLDVAEKENVNGVIAYASDPAAPTAAYVAEKLGLPGNPWDSVEILCNKDRFRKFLREHGFDCPGAAGYTERENAIEQIPKAGLQLPIILKPVDSSGSKGATVLRSYENLPQAVDFAFSFSRGHRIVAEEFIEKRHPYLIGGDVFAADGKIILYGLMNCHRDENVNPLVPVGKSYPPLLEPEDEKKVHKTLQKLVDDLGIRAGAMNVELVVDGAGRVIPIDVGPRNGGNMIPDLLSLIFGVDVVELSVAAAMGCLKPQPIGEGTPFYATHNLHSDRDGIYEAIDFDPELEPYILKKCFYKKAGDPVEFFDNAAKALGIVFFKFPDRKTMEDTLRNIEEKIHIRLK